MNFDFSGKGTGEVEISKSEAKIKISGNVDVINGPNKIVYVSCNPSTQARDVNLFGNNGYKACDIQPIDMFPHTPHIESIVTLKK